jgi:hypothetical protein
MVKFKKRYILVALPAVLAVLFCLLGVYHERKAYVCLECFSLKNVWQWRSGIWLQHSIALTPKRVIIEPSQVCRDFFGDEHEHKWAFTEGSPYYCFGTVLGGWTFGVGRYRGQFVYLYENDSGFRDFVLRVVSQRGIPREKLARLAALPDVLEPGESKPPDLEELTALRDGFFGGYFTRGGRRSGRRRSTWPADLAGPEPPGN